MSIDGLLPGNPHDDKLLQDVAPPDWTWPTPAERYNLVVIGGGPAGLVAAFGAAGVGGKVALVERGLLGGDCLNMGCVPSKAVIRVGHAAHAARDGARFGVSVGGVAVDFAAAMDRMRKIRADIGPHDSAARLQEAGIDVFLGTAAFTGPDAVGVTGRDGRTVTLPFSKALIATGARALVPPIPGMQDVGVRTNETIFALTALPSRLTVVGAGVIGCELAQAFARMGSAVTLLDMGDRVLPREEPDASSLVEAQLRADGVQVRLGVQVAGFEREGEDRVTVLSDDARIASDEILLAVGRRPNLDLDLDKAGVTHTRAGVQVDPNLRTDNPDIFAAGDVIGQAAFTHAADHHARIVLRNALFFGHAKVSELVIPRVTYTQPEVAAVGMTQAEAESTPGVQAFTVSMGETDRGRTDGEAAGYCRVFADAKGQIKGATVVGEIAGELLAPLTLAMTHGLGLAQIASTIHPYPTRSEVVFKVASAYNKTRFTPTAQKLSKALMGWRR